MSRRAPIALFIYNRPQHLARALRALENNPAFADSPLYGYADGPRAPGDEAATTEARGVAVDILGARAEYRFRPGNAGLAESIIAGVSELTAQFGSVIVVEDDLEVAPGFLHF